MEANQEDRHIFTEPVRELREAMFLDDTESVHIMKAVCGLTIAPHVCFAKADQDLRGRGWAAATTEPCLYMKYDATGELVGMVIIREDDFQIPGADWSDNYKAEVERLKTLYKWGTEWKSDADGYVCCGVGMSRLADGGFHLEQE